MSENLISNFYFQEWGKQDSNLRPTDYEGGGIPTNRYHPTAMSIMIKELRIDCYWFLWVDDGGIGAPLHRQCTMQRLLLLFYLCWDA